MKVGVGETSLLGLELLTGPVHSPGSPIPLTNTELRQSRAETGNIHIG